MKKLMDHANIKNCSYGELTRLSCELRREILASVSQNGGHLASNLGMVEATIAIHRVFDLPSDAVVFDVGHQCYTHKLLTGRGEAFKKLRKLSGTSGFTNPGESGYDTTYAGHAGPSLSTAVGMAESRAMRGDKSYVIAVVGDGAFTNGMIYEALNNCVTRRLRLIIILNDNKMSISPNVGALSRFLDNTRTSPSYFNIKHSTVKALNAIPRLGGRAVSAMRSTKNSLRRLFVSDNLFECLGIDYLGPVDGHDIKKLETVLKEAKSRENCCVVHIRTQKGRGYAYAQEHPERYHGVGPFDLERGVQPGAGDSFSDAFGELMCASARRYPQLCAISSAMCDGTGLSGFAKRYPQRFFDVGIAEEHSAAFAGGLALDGRYPVCALYSTFAQRTFDQVFHDIALQRAPVMLALDRCGLVPADGVTHQGLFDVGLFSAIPGVVIYSPETYEELGRVFDRAVGRREFCVLRYPKGREQRYDRSAFCTLSDGDLTYCDYNVNAAGDRDVVILSYGRITDSAVQAAAMLGDSVGVRIIKLVKIFPLDEGQLTELIGSPRLLYILEEGAETGGIAEKLCAMLARRGAGVQKLIVRAAKNMFFPQGELKELYSLCGFLPEQVAAEIGEALGN